MQANSLYALESMSHEKINVKQTLQFKTLTISMLAMYMGDWVFGRSELCFIGELSRGRPCHVAAICIISLRVREERVRST